MASKPKSGSPWWNEDRSAAKKIQIQASVLATLKPEMQRLYARLKTVYRRTLTKAEQEYLDREEMFTIKMLPTAAYGVPLVWEKLSTKDLTILDRTKPAFLKRALGLHRVFRNRLVYLLACTTTFIEDLKLKRLHNLSETSYKEFITRFERKTSEIDPESYRT